MSTKSTEIINETLSIEGYYAKIKGDKGGETYCGISRVANPKWEGWKYVDKAKPLKWNQKVNNTTLDKLVQDFYLKSFYNPLKIESMDSIKISAHLYDLAVNSGTKTSVKLLQQAINNVCKANIAVDGVIGNITLSYANGEHKEEIEKELVNQRINKYKGIVQKNPSQAQFLDGWLNRIQKVEKKFSYIN